ncbi:MAG: hypothetical protein ACYCZR_07760 [Burkholderiales bacterium]
MYCGSFIDSCGMGTVFSPLIVGIGTTGRRPVDGTAPPAKPPGSATFRNTT